MHPINCVGQTVSRDDGERQICLASTRIRIPDIWAGRLATIIAPYGASVNSDIYDVSQRRIRNEFIKQIKYQQYIL